jgi:hypothetical protein
VNRRKMLPVYAVTLVTGVFLPGCGHEWGGGVNSARQGGYDYGTVHLTCDNRVYLLLAVDGRPIGGVPQPKPLDGRAGGKFIAPNARPGGDHHFGDPAPREVTWSSTTRDGKTGNVTVDGEEFDLSKGGLFLVSLMDNQTKVEQLGTDLSQLDGAPSNATGLKLWHAFLSILVRRSLVSRRFGDEPLARRVRERCLRPLWKGNKGTSYCPEGTRARLAILDRYQLHNLVVAHQP